MTYTWSYFMDSESAQIIYTIVQLLQSLLGIASYVLLSWGLYTIAGKRGIHKKWLAWIPVVQVWIVGCISDQYRYIARNEKRNRRTGLIVLTVMETICEIAFLVLMGMMVYYAVKAHFVPAELQMIPNLGGMLILLAISLILMLIVAVINAVFLYICYYDLYLSCSPDNAVVFLVLSIVFSFTIPFFVFAIRNNNAGMPPRFSVTPAE